MATKKQTGSARFSFLRTFHLPGLGDLWAADDPYDLAAVAKDAFEAHPSPRAFFLDMFSEDLARADDDEAQAADGEAEAEGEAEGEQA